MGVRVEVVKMNTTGEWHQSKMASVNMVNFEMIGEIPGSTVNVWISFLMLTLCVLCKSIPDRVANFGMSESKRFVGGGCLIHTLWM